MVDFLQYAIDVAYALNKGLSFILLFHFYFSFCGWILLATLEGLNFKIKILLTLHSGTDMLKILSEGICFNTRTLTISTAQNAWHTKWRLLIDMSHFTGWKTLKKEIGLFGEGWVWDSFSSTKCTDITRHQAFSFIHGSW